VADSNQLLAACGLYCGACYHYRASFAEGAYLLERAAAQGKDLNQFTCQGCRSDRLYIHAGCSNCELRACSESRGYRHCGECPEAPCSRLQAFQHDGHVHHLPILASLDDLNRLGPDAWLEEQQVRWQCSACGAAFSWYDSACPNCGQAVDSFAT
jgi:predicted amidophosphoribosyltransferase